MSVRKGEDSKSWFRTERYYHTGEGWWFMTRENGERGPYESHKDAEQEFFIYLRNLRVYDGLLNK